jgi:hypothetical protein
MTMIVAAAVFTVSALFGAFASAPALFHVVVRGTQGPRGWRTVKSAAVRA